MEFVTVHIRSARNGCKFFYAVCVQFIWT